jgi:hypothetical protein
MGITTSTAAGRAALQHPDFGHDGGTGLWNKVHALYQKIGNCLGVQWFGSYTLADTATQDLVHNFDMNLSELEVHIIESDTILTQELQSVYGISEKSGNEKNEIRIQNNSGGAKTFDVYIFGFSLDKLLGRQKARLVTTDGAQQTLMSIGIPVNEAMAIEYLVHVRKDGTTSNLYKLLVMAEHNGTVASVRICETTEDEDDADWSVTVDANASTVRLRVTGEAATTLEWYCVAQKTYL